MKALKRSLFILIIILLVGVICLRVRYGGGAYYPNVGTNAIFPADSLEVVLEYDEPLGNIAVSENNRIFFSVHPESRPDGNKILEIVEGKPKPYPNEEFQDNYTTVLGLCIDKKNRLWTLDHGFHGLMAVRLLAFDLTTNEVVHDHTFSPDIAERFSFFNDLQVSEEGMVYIADVSFLRKNPGLIVYDSKSGKERRLLEQHTSVLPQDWLIKNKLMDMKFLGGLVYLKPGIDGIVLSSQEDYVYYGAMTHDGLYRIPTSYLNDFSLSEAEIEQAVERVGNKPLSDGLSIDTMNNIYITDVENAGFMRLTPNGELETLFKSEKIRWSDGASFGGDGYLYFTDSAIPDQMLRSKSHINQSSPYYIFRFNPGFGGVPGR